MLLALGSASLRPSRSSFTQHTRAQPAATIMANSSSDEEGGSCFTRSVMRTGRRKTVLLDSPASDAENRTPPASARQPLCTTPTALQHTSLQGITTPVHGSRPSPQVATTKLNSPAAEQRTPCTPRDQATRPLDLHDPFTPWLRTCSKLPPSTTAHQKHGGAAATPAAMRGSSSQSSPSLWSPLSVSTATGAGAATTSPASVGMLRPGRAEAAAAAAAGSSTPRSAVTPGESRDQPAVAGTVAALEHSGSLPTWSSGAAAADDAHTTHAGAACSPASTRFEDAGSPLSQLTGPGAAASPAAAPLQGPGDVSPISISSFGGQSSSMLADCEEVSSRGTTSSTAPGPAATPSPAAACDSPAASSYATATDAAASPAGDATDDASSSWAGKASSARQPPPAAAAAPADEVQPEAEDTLPAAATPVEAGVLAAADGSQQQQQQESATPARTPPPPPAAAARAAAAAHDSSDDEDEGTLLTFTRRRPTGVLRRRPPAAWAGTSSSSSDEASDTSSSSSSGEDDGSDEDSGYVASSRSSGGGSRQGCGHTGCSSNSRPRVTPGSSSSLVARRRGRRLQGSHQHPPQQPQRSTTTAGAGYSGAYNFDLHVSSVSRPGADSSQQQQGDSLALTPVAALSFTPAAAAGGAAYGSSAAGSAARRLSGCFAGAAPPLISPPMLKLQERLQGLQLQPQPPPQQQQRTPAAKPPPAPPSAAKGRKPAAAAAGAMTAPAKAPSSRTFARQRQQLSQQLYAQWNAQVFDGSLPPDLALVWNPRLTATAGQVVDDGSRNAAKASRDERIPVRLELSSKVLDCEARLRSTLAHEMCHVAAWAVSREFKQHHGPAFWAWARRFEGRVPDIKVTTCHSYDVHAPFRWQCSNYSCGKQYHRHKRSIDTVKHVCSRCSGRLVYLGKFSRDGRLIGAASSSSGTPGAGAAAGGTTPGNGGNVFSRFVKAHFADVKRGLPAGMPHKEVMSCLAARYKQQKAAATPVAVSAATAAAAQLAATREVIDLVADESDDDAAGASSWHSQGELAEGDGSLLSFMDRLALS